MVQTVPMAIAPVIVTAATFNVLTVILLVQLIAATAIHKNGYKTTVTVHVPITAPRVKLVITVTVHVTVPRSSVLNCMTLV